MSPARPNRAAMTPKQLRALFARKKVKHIHAAERLGIAHSTVLRWLNGSTPISAANKAHIYLTFGL